MKLAQITLEVRPPDSRPGVSVWSPTLVWLIDKLAPPLPRNWQEFLIRIAGWHPEKNPDVFLLGGPQRPGRGNMLCLEGHPMQGCFPWGNQVLYVIARSHGSVKHESIPRSLPRGGKAFHRFLGVKASYTKSSSSWCSFPRQPGLNQVWLLNHHLPAG